MHGMVDIITVAMAKGPIKKINFSEILSDKTKLREYFYIAMLALFAIIAIILVGLIHQNNRRNMKEYEKSKYEIANINITQNTDENIEKFIKDYFKARTDLNYPKIFSSFGRDYYKEERESKDDKFKKTIDSIRYERMFIKSYDNINIYTEKGFHDDEVICIVTYDVEFGFTTGKAPMILVFYLVKKDDSYYIKEDLDVGTSKYIVDVVNTDSVKNLYDDVYSRLNRVLNSDESMKLVYNSFRQSEMNMKSSLDPIKKREMIENMGVKKIDPVNDMESIFNEISESKRIEKMEDDLENYLDKVVASLSDAQRYSLYEAN